MSRMVWDFGLGTVRDMFQRAHIRYEIWYVRYNI